MDDRIDDPRMDDQFLRDLRKQPDPVFAARLRATLRALPPNAVARVAPAANVRKWFAAAASVAAVSFALTLPVVQAGAQAFLDLFRVVQFTGVQFDPQRLESVAESVGQDLQASGLDLEQLFGTVEPLTTDQEPVSYATADEAGAAAGVRVRAPAWIPPGFSSTGFMVTSEHAARITAKTAGLQLILDALALDDVELPAGLDGQVATVRVPPIVDQAYSDGRQTLHVLQSQGPDVSFPSGLDLAKLAYAGLRILGTPQDEAYRMSTTIDWRTTMIVPVPSRAAAYRPINVAGNQGLLIEGFTNEAGRGHSLLMWAADGQTFAVMGQVNGPELLEVAQTLQ